jgi:hypothetical protein
MNFLPEVALPAAATWAARQLVSAEPRPAPHGSVAAGRWLSVSFPAAYTPSGLGNIGFRVASPIPEPTTALLLGGGLLGLGARRKRR